MKIRQIILTVVTVMLLATSNAGAAKGGNHAGNRGGNNAGNRGSNNAGNRGDSFLAPEIDTASGTSAIALLTGALLLAGERSRSKRP